MVKNPRRMITLIVGGLTSLAVGAVMANNHLESKTEEVKVIKTLADAKEVKLQHAIQNIQQQHIAKTAVEKPSKEDSIKAIVSNKGK